MSAEITAPREPLPVVVVGAGIAGLSAAWTLHHEGVPVTLLEAGAEVGGVIGSKRIGGHLFERGPSTVRSATGLLARLVAEVGLGDRLLRSDTSSERRLVWSRGSLHELPHGPGSLFRSPLLSLGGKLRIFAEPFVRGRTADAPDETLRELLSRRIGAEATAAFADPFVTGVYAGDLDHLGADAMPTLVALEREHGGFLKGLGAKRRAARAAGTPRPPKGLVSFPEGLAELPEKIREHLGTRVRLGHEVFSLERDGDRWRVHALADERQVAYDAAGVVLALPAHRAALLLEGLDPELPGPIGKLPSPHVAVVGLGYRAEQVTGDMDAFGFLCASTSPLPGGEPVLGVLFNSSIFPQRAPEGGITLTVILGGSRYPDSADLLDQELVGAARAVVRELCGARGEPAAVLVQRWPRALPQYPPGHLREVAALTRRLEAWPGLALAGSYLEGVGLEPSATSGVRAAESLRSASHALAARSA